MLSTSINIHMWFAKPEFTLHNSSSSSCFQKIINTMSQQYCSHQQALAAAASLEHAFQDTFKLRSGLNTLTTRAPFRQFGWRRNRSSCGSQVWKVIHTARVGRRQRPRSSTNSKAVGWRLRTRLVVVVVAAGTDMLTLRYVLQLHHQHVSAYLQLSVVTLFEHINSYVCTTNIIMLPFFDNIELVTSSFF